MKSNRMGRRKLVVLARLGMLGGAASLYAVLVAGWWFWPGASGGGQALLAAALLALTGGLGIAWQWRARAARRFQVAMNAFVDRQIAWTRRRRGGLALEGIPIHALRSRLAAVPPEPAEEDAEAEDEAEDEDDGGTAVGRDGRTVGRSDSRRVLWWYGCGRRRGGGDSPDAPLSQRPSELGGGREPIRRHR